MVHRVGWVNAHCSLIPLEYLFQLWAESGGYGLGSPLFRHCIAFFPGHKALLSKITAHFYYNGDPISIDNYLYSSEVHFEVDVATVVYP